MEYIQTLIDTDSLKTSPTDIPNKRDLVKEGVDFTDQTPSFIIDVPKGGAIIRDLDVISANVAEITVTFITESGEKVGPIRGAPTALPTEEFPKEKVDEIVIKVTKTTDYRPPQDVILSVTACAEGTKGTTILDTTQITTQGTTAGSYGTSEGSTEGTTTWSYGSSEGTTEGRTTRAYGTSEGTSEGTTTRSYGTSGGSTEETTTRAYGTTVGTTEGTTTRSYGTDEATTQGTTGQSVGTTQATTEGTRTTGKYCDEMEYIQTLIDTDSVKTSPIDIPNKRDLVKEGVDFTDLTPSFIIDVPKGGAIIRDLDLTSSNVAEITVTFTTESGEKVGPMRGAPTALPREEFPKDKVDEIVIKVTKTTDYRAPQDVILSVTACAEGTTTTTAAGKISSLLFCDKKDVCNVNSSY